MNNVIIIGNLGQDVELKYTGSGVAVAELSVAVNDGKDRPPVWVPVTVWKEQAENAAKWLKKGSKVAVNGRLAVDQWEKDGQKRTKMKVVGFSVEYLSGYGDDKPAAKEEGGFVPSDDDVPF